MWEQGMFIMIDVACVYFALELLLNNISFAFFGEIAWSFSFCLLRLIVSKVLYFLPS